MHYTWTYTDSYLIGVFDYCTINEQSKLAIFDLDHTIIKPIKGIFSKGSDDWVFYSDTVVEQLQQYHKDKFTIVIVTNQNGIDKGTLDAETWITKITNIVDIIKVPIIILASLKKDMYRKPMPFLFYKALSLDTTPCSVRIKDVPSLAMKSRARRAKPSQTVRASVSAYNKQKSFYCGDAGGLPKRTINNIVFPKDFSDTDLKFAQNLNVKFIHRDDFIFNYKTLSECPMQKAVIGKGLDIFKDIIHKKHLYKKINSGIVIINVGFPGSGKTRYTEELVKTQSNSIRNKALTEGLFALTEARTVCAKDRKTNVVSAHQVGEGLALRARDEIARDGTSLMHNGLPQVGEGLALRARDEIARDGTSLIIINQDTLKTKAKCLKQFKLNLDSGVSIIIDNTNPSEKSRKEYIDLAKQMNYKIHCNYFTTSRAISMHNNIYRHIISNGIIPIIPEIVYNIYNKHFQEPSLQEGFDSINKIPFYINPDEQVDENYFLQLY